MEQTYTESEKKNHSPIQMNVERNKGQVYITDLVWGLRKLGDTLSREDAIEDSDLLWCLKLSAQRRETQFYTRSIFDKMGSLHIKKAPCEDTETNIQ